MSEEQVFQLFINVIVAGSVTGLLYRLIIPRKL